MLRINMHTASTPVHSSRPGSVSFLFTLSLINTMIHSVRQGNIRITCSFFLWKCELRAYGVKNSIWQGIVRYQTSVTAGEPYQSAHLPPHGIYKCNGIQPSCLILKQWARCRQALGALYMLTMSACRLAHNGPLQFMWLIPWSTQLVRTTN